MFKPRSDIYTIFNRPVTFPGTGHTPPEQCHLPWENTSHMSYEYAGSLSHLSHNSRPPGSHHCWVGCCSMEWDVCLTLLHITSGGKSNLRSFWSWAQSPIIGLSLYYIPIVSFHAWYFFYLQSYSQSKYHLAAMSGWAVTTSYGVVYIQSQQLCSYTHM